jgi:predicted signal transduction protein with EAL and GGDEF domain
MMPKYTIDRFAQLRKLGYSSALDEFGFTHAGLNHKVLPHGRIRAFEPFIATY